MNASAMDTGPAPAVEDARAVEALRAFAGLDPDDPRRDRARQRAIEAWLPMAHRLARRFGGRGEREEDLRQIAAVGLIKAIDRYEPAAGDFVGFAIPTVLGEIRRHFRDRTWSVHVPRRLQELRLAISDANGVLTHALGRSPTVAEVAAHLRVTEEEVVEGLEGARAYRAMSLSAPAGPADDVALGDTLGATDPGFDLAEARLDLGPALRTLTGREREILALRFYRNLTQAQIGERIGVSQMQVSRLLAGALDKLRAHMLAR